MSYLITAVRVDCTFDAPSSSKISPKFLQVLDLPILHSTNLVSGAPSASESFMG